jgi:hypothetical protein
MNEKPSMSVITIRLIAKTDQSPVTTCDMTADLNTTTQTIRRDKTDYSTFTSTFFNPQLNFAIDAHASNRPVSNQMALFNVAPIPPCASIAGQCSIFSSSGKMKFPRYSLPNFSRQVPK